MVMPDYHAYSIGVEWHLTFRCNLNCAHCSVASYRNEEFINKVYNLGDLKNIRELRYSEWVTFLEMLEKSHYTAIRVVFSPTNGESTVHPDFVDIWNALSDIKNVSSLWITTNGTTLWKYLDKMDLTKLGRITFSIDGGTAEVHEKIRGRGTFDSLWKSIELIDSLKHDDPGFYLQVNYVINGLNADSLKNLPHLFRHIKSKVIVNVFPIDISTGNARVNHKLLSISWDEVEKNFAKMYAELKKINYERNQENLPPIKVYMHEVSSRVFRLFKRLNGLSLKDFSFNIQSTQSTWKSCAAYNKRRIYLDPYGNVYPCGKFAEPIFRKIFYGENGYYAVPNIMDGLVTIEDILNSKFFVRARRWIDELYKKIQCRNCPLKTSCPFCPITVYQGGVKDECLKI